MIDRFVARWLDPAITVIASLGWILAASLAGGQPCAEDEPILAEPPLAEERFGAAIAVDGQTAVVAAPGAIEGSGSIGRVLVYELNDGQWAYVATLSTNDAAPGDQFGACVAIDRDTIVVGAPQTRTRGKYSGAAYVFQRPLQGWQTTDRADATLTAVDATPGDGFGWSVDVSDDRIVAGAPGDDDIADEAGAVYIFERPRRGWRNLRSGHKLYPVSSAEGQHFGFHAELVRGLLVVSAPALRHTTPGSVHIFRHDGVDWDAEQSFDAGDLRKRTDHFGRSISLDRDPLGLRPDQLAVGATGYDTAGEHSGAVFLYRLDDPLAAEPWVRIAAITPPDISRGDHFGMAVSLRDDMLIASSSHDDSEVRQAGSVYVYRRDAVADVWENRVKLLARCSNEFELFGVHLQTFDDADRTGLLVGAPQRNLNGIPRAGIVLNFRDLERY